MSAAQSHVLETYIIDSLGKCVNCVTELKVLGFYFDTTPNAWLYVKKLKKKIRGENGLTLRHLRKRIFLQTDLVKVYKAMIRPYIP